MRTILLRWWSALDSSKTYEGTPCKKFGHTLRYVANGGCVECENANRNNRPRHKRALSDARYRAKRDGVPFSLTEDDLPPVPHICPVLGIMLAPGNRTYREASPSLDRIVPSKGYVPGNVHWISYRANKIKNDASVGELRKVADYFERIELSNNGPAS